MRTINPRVPGPVSHCSPRELGCCLAAPFPASPSTHLYHSCHGCTVCYLPPAWPSSLLFLSYRALTQGQGNTAGALDGVSPCG
ncbi:mitochondrial ribosomal protein S18A, isoform CRA_a [Rattus norvegicus]|uniref:Mitochondrial ribosomal protein S18A, isoform CRA_a n=1 Tax=Rattus norvegicus TaxID=10116 RepID=A6JIU2_RAT|nr:mitochondrial ribosomal protein S18A, isoform CRA_a [Rattus norvegicus]